MYSPVPDVKDVRGDDDDDATTGSQPLNILQNLQLWIWRIFLGTFFLACLIFGAYTAGFFVRAFLSGEAKQWDTSLPGIYHKDRFDSNFGIGIHFVAASYLMLFGPLQFVKSIRRNAISFHRWNGRLTIGCGIMASLGGLYYIFAVGTTTVGLLGQQANVTNALFGLVFLVCTVGTYYHAAVTKNIPLHRLWAYRLAGVNLGNMYVRLYLVGVFAVMGADVDQATLKSAVTFLVWTFAIPFALMGDVLWRQEQQQELHKDKSSPNPWKILFGFLVVMIFITTVILQSVLYWVPFMVADLTDYNNSTSTYDFLEVEDP